MDAHQRNRTALRSELSRSGERDADRVTEARRLPGTQSAGTPCHSLACAGQPTPHPWEAWEWAWGHLGRGQGRGRVPHRELWKYCAYQTETHTQGIAICFLECYNHHLQLGAAGFPSGSPPMLAQGGERAECTCKMQWPLEIRSSGKVSYRALNARSFSVLRAAPS